LPEEQAKQALGTAANFRLWQAGKLAAAPELAAAAINPSIPRPVPELHEARFSGPYNDNVESKATELKKHFEDFLSELPQPQKRAVNDYVMNSTTLNRHLAGTKKIDSDYLPETQRAIDALDSMFAKAPAMKSDTTVFSGLQGSVKRQLMDMKVGDELVVKRYLSSSLSGAKAGDFVDEHHSYMQIHVSKGSHGTAYIESISNIASERELLINRGSKFRLLGKKKDGKETYYIVELITQ
jgi:hypothetical protein